MSHIVAMGDLFLLLGHCTHLFGIYKNDSHWPISVPSVVGTNGFRACRHDLKIDVWSLMCLLEIKKTDLSLKCFGECTKNTYKQMFGLQWFQFRAAAANNTVFSHCYNGAIMAGVDVDDGDAMTQCLHRGWQSESHLLAASHSFLILFVFMHHVCAELTLRHITLCQVMVVLHLDSHIKNYHGFIGLDFSGGGKQKYRNTCCKNKLAVDDFGYFLHVTICYNMLSKWMTLQIVTNVLSPSSMCIEIPDLAWIIVFRWVTALLAPLIHSELTVTFHRGIVCKVS